jgi:hypothetical protein
MLLGGGTDSNSTAPALTNRRLLTPHQQQSRTATASAQHRISSLTDNLSLQHQRQHRTSNSTSPAHKPTTPSRQQRGQRRVSVEARWAGSFPKSRGWCRGHHRRPSFPWGCSQRVALAGQPAGSLQGRYPSVDDKPDPQASESSPDTPLDLSQVDTPPATTVLLLSTPRPDTHTRSDQVTPRCRRRLTPQQVA